ncbi:MAG TPA: hypothetical protein VGW34_04980 [Allosphingosinicella sp.]|nr:hypothetical protein [Allosphingosinicella sp.]
MNAPRHLAAVRDVLDNAAEPPADDFPGAGSGGRWDRGGDWDGPEPCMPPGCPVYPLGTHDNIFWFLTALGELRGLPADKVANKHIVAMFAPFDAYLEQHWPRMKWNAKLEEWEPVPNTWKADDTTKQLMRVAAWRGVWNAADKVRGRGAHRDEDGRLILHCGNHVLHGGMWQRPWVIDGLVYPAAPALPRPGPKSTFTLRKPGAKAIEVNAAEELLSWLRTWNWARPQIDPILALGWIVGARLGGAFDWRTLIWITGGAATGKSTLMDLVKALFDGGLLKLGSATEAAVRQLLGQDTLPVLLDETEAEEDDRKLRQILGLARIAASGDDIGKGGQDHQGVKFTARSSFIFSSILIPPLAPADKSRFVVLELGELPKNGRAPKISAADKREMCAALTRRMVDHWGRWERTLEAYRDALIDYGGHKSRGADVFGTLLAAAHIALDDEPPGDEELVVWGNSLAADRLAELSDNAHDGERCLHHLATSLVQLDGRGLQQQVSEWVWQASQPVPADDVEARDRVARARDQLAKIGVGIFVGKARKGAGDRDKPQPVAGRTYVGVASNHQGLARLFAESPWKGNAAAGGGWAQSLKRIANAVPNEKQRIGRTVMACTLVPVEAMWGAIEPEPEAVGQAAEVEHA